MAIGDRMALQREAAAVRSFVAIHAILPALIVLAALLAGPAAAGEASGTADRPRAVIELFTSQGCSSCPPADRLMAEWAERPDLIILSMPVDYWDYLGWKDTLADIAFSHRQRGYSGARGDRQVYTPQAVINGVTHVVGSDRRALESAIAAQGSGTAMRVLVEIAPVSGNATQIRLGKAPAGTIQSGTLWLVPVLGPRTVQIGRGENTGRSITYASVARPPKRLADWTGEPQVVPVTALPAGADSIVVLLQAGSDKKPGMILGAARATLPQR